MSLLGYFVLVSSILVECEANESIANAFENWDFGHYNSHSYELLIVVCLAVLVMAVLLFIMSLLFIKCVECVTDRDRNKTCDLERGDKKENWLQEKDEEVTQMLIQAELIRMQGDFVPVFEFAD